ncbi:retinitis pigmentosa gtpase regulator a-related [Anaeramoeba flamelloides]|uniref:Retinitis pigmentosa gtpase regulator a-related n=1 Tax=Anaeramoeba flamelloides TaxID=1746091 RepID=A0AAV8A320_9EUKA|nr:retinitis pigmentosa gtpase regulator a-related [Anaeramoeba flamelloides]
MSSQVQHWLNSIFFEPVIPKSTLHLSQILCDALNKLQNGIISKISETNHNKNYSNFLDGCKRLGVELQYLPSQKELIETPNDEILGPILRELTNIFPPQQTIIIRAVFDFSGSSYIFQRHHSDTFYLNPLVLNWQPKEIQKLKDRVNNYLFEENAAFDIWILKYENGDQIEDPEDQGYVSPNDLSARSLSNERLDNEGGFVTLNFNGKGHFILLNQDSFEFCLEDKVFSKHKYDLNHQLVAHPIINSAVILSLGAKSFVIILLKDPLQRTLFCSTFLAFQSNALGNKNFDLSEIILYPRYEIQHESDFNNSKIPTLQTIGKVKANKEKNQPIHHLNYNRIMKVLKEAKDPFDLIQSRFTYIQTLEEQKEEIEQQKRRLLSKKKHKKRKLLAQKLKKIDKKKERKKEKQLKKENKRKQRLLLKKKKKQNHQNDISNSDESENQNNINDEISRSNKDDNGNGSKEDDEASTSFSFSSSESSIISDGSRNSDDQLSNLENLSSEDSSDEIEHTYTVAVYDSFDLGRGNASITLNTDHFIIEDPIDRQNPNEASKKIKRNYSLFSTLTYDICNRVRIRFCIDEYQGFAIGFFTKKERQMFITEFETKKIQYLGKLLNDDQKFKCRAKTNKSTYTKAILKIRNDRFLLKSPKSELCLQWNLGMKINNLSTKNLKKKNCAEIFLSSFQYVELQFIDQSSLLKVIKVFNLSKKKYLLELNQSLRISTIGKSLTNNPMSGTLCEIPSTTFAYVNNKSFGFCIPIINQDKLLLISIIKHQLVKKNIFGIKMHSNSLKKFKISIDQTNNRIINLYHIDHNNNKKKKKKKNKGVPKNNMKKKYNNNKGEKHSNQKKGNKKNIEIRIKFPDYKQTQTWKKQLAKHSLINNPKQKNINYNKQRKLFITSFYSKKKLPESIAFFELTAKYIKIYHQFTIAKSPNTEELLFYDDIHQQNYFYQYTELKDFVDLDNGILLTILNPKKKEITSSYLNPQRHHLVLFVNKKEKVTFKMQFKKYRANFLIKYKNGNQIDLIKNVGRKKESKNNANTTKNRKINDHQKKRSKNYQNKKLNKKITKKIKKEKNREKKREKTKEVMRNTNGKRYNKNKSDPDSDRYLNRDLIRIHNLNPNRNRNHDLDQSRNKKKKKRTSVERDKHREKYREKNREKTKEVIRNTNGKRYNKNKSYHEHDLNLNRDLIRIHNLNSYQNLKHTQNESRNKKKKKNRSVERDKYREKKREKTKEVIQNTNGKRYNKNKSYRERDRDLNRDLIRIHNLNSNQNLKHTQNESRNKKKKKNRSVDRDKYIKENKFMNKTIINKHNIKQNNRKSISNQNSHTDPISRNNFSIQKKDNKYNKHILYKNKKINEKKINEKNINQKKYTQKHLKYHYSDTSSEGNFESENKRNKNKYFHDEKHLSSDPNFHFNSYYDKSDQSNSDLDIDDISNENMDESLNDDLNVDSDSRVVLNTDTDADVDPNSHSDSDSHVSIFESGSGEEFQTSSANNSEIVNFYTKISKTIKTPDMYPIFKVKNIDAKNNLQIFSTIEILDKKMKIVSEESVITENIQHIQILKHLNDERVLKVGFLKQRVRFRFQFLNKKDSYNFKKITGQKKLLILNKNVNEKNIGKGKKNLKKNQKRNKNSQNDYYNNSDNAYLEDFDSNDEKEFKNVYENNNNKQDYYYDDVFDYSYSDITDTDSSLVDFD